MSKEDKEKMCKSLSTQAQDHLLNDSLNEDKETLTEAPDDDGIMSDDELDAEEERERADFEARMKARRDKVAQQRAERDAKIAKENELKAKADEIVKTIGDDWSFEHLFDVLVPDSGKCDTLAGEILRAVNKIEYRWFNDGDRWFEDYGIETAGPAAKFLMNVEIDDETPFWDAVLISAENNYDGNYYDRWVEDMKKFAVDTIKANPTLLAKETSDMLDIDYRDVERWLDDEGLVPTYETDADIPSELDAHLEKGNISERDIQWEVESWCENAGCYNASVEVNGYVYIDGLNKAAYDELDGNLYRWLEQYAEDLTEEYGDPYEEDSSDWAESIANELGQDVDMVQNVLDTHKFDSYDDAIDYIKELIEEEAEESEEEGEE